MPVWLQVMLASAAWGVPLMTVMVRVLVRTSQTNQHFDPTSPVSQAMGATMPEQIRALRMDHQDQKAQLDDLIAWRPNVEQHQARQDGRLHALDGSKHG